MNVGYARVSTVDQVAGFDAQLRDLKAAGCGRVFQERVSALDVRAELAAAIDYVREGDTFTVTKPDRLARSTGEMLELLSRLNAKGVGLVVLSMGPHPIDGTTAIGKMMITMLAAMATFERDLMLERQREGIAKAKADGKYKGRAPTAMRQSADVMAMLDASDGPAAVARKLKIGRTSVYRIMAGSKAE